MKFAPAFLRHSGRIRFLAIVLLLGAGVLAFFVGRPTPVDVQRVAEGEMRQAVVASGRVRTPQRIELASQITGRIAAMHVSDGDAVQAGQLLIQLDDAEWLASQKQARATLAQHAARRRQIESQSLPQAEQALRQADATAAQARRQFARSESLIARGFYSPAQLDDARRALEIAEAQRESAALQLAALRENGADRQIAQANLEQGQAALAVADARLAQTRLTAPVDGRILQRHAEPGDLAQVGKTLLVIAPSSAVELTAQIDEKHLGALAIGQHALAEADAYPGQRFAAVLNYIAPTVDAQRGSVEIHLRVPDAPTFLKQEMTVSIDIETGRRARALMAPAGTVRDSADGPWVLVVRDGRTVRQPVRLGLRGATGSEVLEGLSAGEAIIPAGQMIAEGRRVSPRQD